LTDCDEFVTLAHMESRLRNLLGRIKRAIKTPRDRADLAAFLRAPRESVSRWLSGKQEPGGETALRALQWVETRERQQKQNRGHAPARPRPKTQLRKSKHERPKSSPKK
jgi:hypothetical protein